MAPNNAISEEFLRENSDVHKALICIDGYVYDITDFLASHPGGVDILYPHLGTDCSEVFRGKAGATHTHSNAAVDMLDQYCIGKLEGATVKERTKKEDQLHLDLTQPLVWQVPKLGKHYNDYIHRPQHMKEPARFFANPFLELCSRTPWYVIPSLWWPVVALELRYSMVSRFVPPPLALGLFAGGIFTWTLVEYCLHRFLFHISEDIVHWSDNTIRFHFLIHGCHHFLPMDRMRLVFPPIPAFAIMTILYSSFHLTMGADFAPAFMAGCTFGYTLYDLIHYYLHHGYCVTDYFRSMKTYHLAHHYKNPILGFGISSKLWDWVFGTML